MSNFSTHQSSHNSTDKSTDKSTYFPADCAAKLASVITTEFAADNTALKATHCTTNAPAKPSTDSSAFQPTSWPTNSAAF